MLELCENGIFSDELSMKLLGYVGDKTIALVKEANKKTESLLKSIGMDRFNELVTFIFDPEFKKSLSPDKIKELENLIEENKKFEEPKPVEDEVTNTQTSDGWTITKNKTEYIKFKKDTNYDTKIEGTSPDFTFYYKLKQQ
jgi:hypothetical protein